MLFSAFTSDIELVKEKCDVRIISQISATFWNIPETNYWFYAVPAPTRITTMCHNARGTHTHTPTSVHINGTGFFSLNSRCMATAGSSTLYSHFTITTHITRDADTIVVPNFDDIRNLVNVTPAEHFVNKQADQALIQALQAASEKIVTPDGLSADYFTRLLDVELDNIDYPVKKYRSELIIFFAIIFIALVCYAAFWVINRKIGIFKTSTIRRIMTLQEEQDAKHGQLRMAQSSPALV